MILDNWNTICEILLKITNKSLEKGIFPEYWKASMITPVGKVSKKNKCEECRPIKSLKLCEQILEKIITKKKSTRTILGK